MGMARDSSTSKNISKQSLVTSTTSKEEKPEICQKCGASGYSEYLIYCSQCKVSAEHRYCLDNMPKQDVIDVIWSCEQCAPRAASSFNRLGLHPFCRSKRLRIKKRKKTIKFSKAETNVQNSDITAALQSHKLCLKGDTQTNEDTHDSAEVTAALQSHKLCLKGDTQTNEDMHDSAEVTAALQSHKLCLKGDTQTNGDMHDSAEVTAALQSHKLCLKKDTQTNEDMLESAVVTTADPLPHKGNYHQHSSDGNREGAKKLKKQRRKLILDDEGSSDEDSGSAEDRNSPVAPDVRDAPFGLSSHEPSHKLCLKGVTRTNEDMHESAEVTAALQSHKLCLKGDTQTNEDMHDSAEVTTTDPLPHKCNYHQHSSDGNREGAKKLKKQRRKLILDDEGSSDEDSGSAEDGNSPVAPDVRNAPFGLSSHEPSHKLCLKGVTRTNEDMHESAEVTAALQSHKLCLKGETQTNEDMHDSAEVTTTDPLPHKGNYHQHSSDGNCERAKKLKKQRRKLILDDEGSSALQSHKLCLKGETQTNEDMHDSAEVTTTDPLPHKGNYHQHSSDGNRERAKKLKKQRRKLILDDEGSSDEDSGSAENGNSLVAPDIRIAPFGLSSHEPSHKLCLKGVTRTNEDIHQSAEVTAALQSHKLCLKGDTQTNEDMNDSAEVTTTDPLPHKGNYHQHSSDGNREGAKKLKKQRRKLILDDEGSSDEDSGSAEDRNSPVAPDVRNAPFGLSSHEPSHKLCLKGVTRTNEDMHESAELTAALQSHKLCLKGDTQTNEDMHDSAEVTTTDPLPHKGNYHQHSSDGNREGAKKLKKQRRKLILDDEGSSDEDGGSAEDTNSLVAPDVRNAPFGLSSHEPSQECVYSGPAQPIYNPVWRGCFSICSEKSGKVVGIVAHLSNKACFKVLEGANGLPVLLGVEMLPRKNAWPKSFSSSTATDDCIGLFFFPESKRDEEVFNGLLHAMIDRDLALKSVTDNAELLIFSSLQLPQRFQRFQGKYYLWGVFREKQVSHLPQPADNLLIRDSSIECAMPSMSADNFSSRKVRGLIKTWSQWSPHSPLSISSYGSDSTQSPLHQKVMLSGLSSITCHDIIVKSVVNEQDLEQQHAYEEEQHAFEEKGEVVLLHNGESWLDSFDSTKENIGIEGSCLKLFPLEMEDVVSKEGSNSEVDLDLTLGRSGREDSKSRSIGTEGSCLKLFPLEMEDVVSNEGSNSEVDLDLTLGRSGREDSKSRSPSCKQLIGKSCTLGLNKAKL